MIEYVGEVYSEDNTHYHITFNVYLVSKAPTKVYQLLFIFCPMYYYSIDGIIPILNMVVIY